MIGRIHSIQSLGTVDGPGIRFVVFLKGCNLRCACCHNPDTFQGEFQELCAEDLVKKALNYREYFKDEGGITLSGGEPLLQAEFCEAVFKLSKEKGINTCLDTSGSILDDKVKALLKVTDRVLLDIKYTNNEDYLKYAGCTLDSVLKFLDFLNENNIKTTLRQVVIPTKNTFEENFLKLKEIKNAHPCVDKVELLPFKKICQTKYDNLNMVFPFKDLPEPTKEEMSEYNKIVCPL